ncbi:hypothetical protein H9Q69_000087 [Fusarium xylarioides]|nr:hypothetical protein H9Q69_000087 [Fusarium xylarioides]
MPTLPPLITLEEHFVSANLLPELSSIYSEQLKHLPEVANRLTDLDSLRLQDMDKNDIALQIVSHAPGLGPKPLHLSRLANDELAQAVQAQPGRLAGFAVLPMSEPEAAAAELRRCVRDLGFVGALVDAHVDGTHYDDRHFWPVFRAAAELDVPMYLHPTYPSEPHRSVYEGEYEAGAARSLGSSGFGWHQDTGLSVLKLFAAGLFDELPTLKVVVGHFGEMLPFMMERIEKLSVRWGKRQRPWRQVWDENIWITTSGASGQLGREVLIALVEDKSFDVTVLARDGGQPADYPPEVRVAKVNYESPDSLQDALRGIDAVISTVGKKSGLECQFKLIDAAVVARVKRFIPSEFGADLQHPPIREFPTYRAKAQTEEYLERLAKETDLSYTYIYNSLLFDYALQLNVFGDFTARTVHMYDGGDGHFSATRIVTVARAVVAVLRKPEETKNRAVRITDISTSPRELLERLQRLDPKHEWTPVNVDTEAQVKEAQDKLVSGRFSPKAFAAFATRATFAPGIASICRGDNELLGLQEMTEEELETLLKEKMSSSRQ